MKKSDSNKHNHSLLSKLFNREVQGYFPGRSTAPGSLFQKFPGRLAFCLKDIVPSPNALNNHVFLGFSKCGQFVISYTQTTEFDETSTVYMQYRYRLHWWAFAPHQHLRKVSEVTLFGEQVIDGRLFLAVCYWPDEDDRIVVYGCSDWTDELTVQDPRCYLTITAVPSLSGCADCVRVAESYGDDDLAESWDSCVRFSCLRHGATVHTTYELVSPYPAFQPRLSLRRRGTIVINTGNFLHALTTCQTPTTAGTSFGDTADDASCVESDRLSLVGLEVDVGDEGPHTPSAAPWRYEPARATCGVPWRFDPRSPRADDCRLRSPRAEDVRRRSAVPSSGLLPARAEMESRAGSPASMPAGEVTPPRRPAIRGWRRGLPAVRQPNISTDEYEFSEEGSDAHRENFTLFRRKRLADKKYEFSDENSENVPRFFAPWRASVAATGGGTDGPCLVPVSDALLSPAGGINSKRRLLAADDAEDRRSVDGESVLRTISCNTEPERFLSAESDCESVSEVSSLMTASPRPVDRFRERAAVVPPPASPGGCCVLLRRRYAEVDDELVSVITDIEEDDLSRATGYHYALPLEVHGAGYAQLQMVTHTKADKLRLPGISVSQLSLDVEQFCHEISQRLCADAGKKYWFCNDYDVEIIEVHPDSGLVLAVAVVLVQAAVRMKGSPPRAAALHRCQYRASFTFSWSMDTGAYTMLAAEPLTEVGDPSELRPGVGRPWQPARLMAAALRDTRPLPQTAYSAIKVVTNQPALTGTSLTTIVDPLNMTALLLTPLPSAADADRD